MVTFLQGKVSERKIRLFLVACARSNWVRFEPADMRQAVEAAEKFADGLVSEECLREHNAAMYGYATRGDREAREWMFGAMEKQCIHRLALATTFNSLGLAKLTQTVSYWHSLYLTEASQPALIRDVFGPLPFRSILFRPDWRTANVLALSHDIYEERAFPRLPILGEALIRAGCENEDIIDHLRSEGPHVRGCWVLDLVLNKE
jgi:hypothetical protein